jgi:hypothetical protein
MTSAFGGHNSGMRCPPATRIQSCLIRGGSDERPSGCERPSGWRDGANLALLRELIHGDRVDHGYISRHTVGFAELAEQVERCAPERAARICDMPAHDIRRGADLLGCAQRLLCTVLQGAA